MMRIQLVNLGIKHRFGRYPLKYSKSRVEIYTRTSRIGARERDPVQLAVMPS